MSSVRRKSLVCLACGENYVSLSQKRGKTWAVYAGRKLLRQRTR